VQAPGHPNVINVTYTNTVVESSRCVEERVVRQVCRIQNGIRNECEGSASCK